MQGRCCHGIAAMTLLLAGCTTTCSCIGRHVNLLLQGGTGTNMLVDGGDAGNAAAMNLMVEDRVCVFGGRSKRRR